MTEPDPATAPPDVPTVLAAVRPRLALVAGSLWAVAGLVLVVGGVVVLADQGRLSWELPVGLLAVASGWWLGDRRLVVDAHGIEQRVAWRRGRLQWSALDAVAVDTVARRRGSVVVRRSRDDRPLALTASLGSTRAQRAALLEVLRTGAARHAVAVVPGHVPDERPADPPPAASDPSDAPAAPTAGERLWTANPREI